MHTLNSISFILTKHISCTLLTDGMTCKNIITFIGGFLIEISTMPVHHKCRSGKHSVTGSPLYVCLRSPAQTMYCCQHWWLLRRQVSLTSGCSKGGSQDLRVPSGPYSVLAWKNLQVDLCTFFFLLNKWLGNVHSSRSCLSWKHSPKSLVKYTVSLSGSVPHPLKDIMIQMWRDA